MTISPTLDRLGKRLPPRAALLAKRVGVWARYAAQRRACRRGFVEHGSRYPQRTLFIAGLPKSGTTWLEKMIASFPGFHECMIPEVAAHEAATGGSHDYELPEDMFERFGGMLALVKMHVHGSAHNVETLRRAGVRYAVLHRDLRDVAVSNYFYVRQTPWHPEHRVYAGLGLQEGLREFAVRTLPAYIGWVRSWRANRDPERSVEVRYEEMLRDAPGVVRALSDLWGLGASDEEVRAIVEANRFDRLAKGSGSAGKGEGSFFRKGVAGDWRNQFDAQTTRVYREALAEFMREQGGGGEDDW